MTYIWLAVCVFALIAEAMTVQMIAVWFAPAALIALVCSMLGAPLWVQIIVFLAVSALCVILFYKKLSGNIKSKCEKTNLDAVVGAVADVEEAIPAYGTGRVKIKGISWKATSETAVNEGEKVKILKIDGVTVTCEPVKLPETINA